MQISRLAVGSKSQLLASLEINQALLPTRLLVAILLFLHTEIGSP